MKVVVTGAAGFIGSNLCDRLLGEGHSVVGIDNLSTGSMRFLESACAHDAFRLERRDLLETSGLPGCFEGSDLVVHLAANADVRFGTDRPSRDLQQNIIATFNVLEAMRAAGVSRIAFSSTGSVYGEPDVFPTPENAPFPVQTSLYGASKAAGEALICAFCEGFGFQGWIFRFVSILGERYTHGHVLDFYKSLLGNPAELPVLGDGRQKKSYLYVQDCIDAMLLAVARARDRVNIFNLGTDEYCEVNDSIGWIAAHLGLKPALKYAGGARGWIGDSPFIFLDCAKIRSLGWTPKLSIRQGVLRTLEYLQANRWVLDARMKVCVFGLWHLGCVTAGCLAAAGHDVRALDPDAETVASLRRGEPPIAEPGLPELIAAGVASRRLEFFDDAAEAVRGCRVLWVTLDTPVDDEDLADTQYVFDRVRELLPLLDEGTLLLVSSQLPAGTCKALEEAAQGRFGVACSPENLRLGAALEAFRNPDRIIVGTRTEGDRRVLEQLLAPVTQRIEWMSVESAEMTKHAINAFLALSVTFANEIASVCEQVGADARDVERGLKTESRIGPGAYLSPGAAFAGGTLARDVAYLNRLGAQASLRTPLLASVTASNDHHRDWPRRKLVEALGGVAGRTIAVWGLTYKVGTDTLRRSASLELCRWLLGLGANVRAHDPAVSELPRELARVLVCASPEDAARGADALVVMTGWPQYKAAPAVEAVKNTQVRTIVDAARILPPAARTLPGIRYYAVGTVTAGGAS